MKIISKNPKNNENQEEKMKNFFAKTLDFLK